MQTFVSKSDLATSATVIHVYGSYPDSPWVDRNSLGPSCTPLTLPGNAVALIDPVMMPGMYQLASNWRDNTAMICQWEAKRRIEEVFPDYMQSNANNDVNQSTIKYGTDHTQWPQDAQDRYNEGLRGWNYVTAVRQNSAALINSFPPDPTDNSHWPTVISPPIFIAPA